MNEYNSDEGLGAGGGVQNHGQDQNQWANWQQDQPDQAQSDNLKQSQLGQTLENSQQSQANQAQANNQQHGQPSQAQGSGQQQGQPGQGGQRHGGAYYAPPYGARFGPNYGAYAAGGHPGGAYYGSYYGPYHQYPHQGAAKKKGLKGWHVGLIIFISALVLCLLVSLLFKGSNQPGGFSALSPYIARINVEGTIASSPSSDILGNVAGYYHSWTLDKIDQLMEDSNNRGMIIYVDSPGGGVYESDELYLKIKEYKEATGCPVYVAMGSMAASGGYYIAAAADKIYANRNTWTGSIGVTMGTFIDISGFLKQHGVETHTMTSGRNKAMGGYFDPMTDEQSRIFQSLIDDAYFQFTGIVADERSYTDHEILEIADGRIYTARQALELGLIDAIGTYDEAVEDMQAEYGLEHCPVIEEHYYNSSLLGRVLGSEFADGLTALLSYGRGDVGAVLAFADAAKKTPIMYMYGE